MKSKIYMYLFFFALLLVVFQYMNSKKIFESEDQKLNYAQTELTKYKDSVVTLVQKNNQLQYFSLESNDDALSYFDNLKINNLPNYITDQLISTNEKKEIIR